jgi:hypothetical protein
MSAIAFELPVEVREACNVLTAFARSEVVPRHEKYHPFILNGSGRLKRSKPAAPR